MHALRFREFLARERFAVIAATVHWLTSFVTERFIFEVAPTADLLNYILCKAILFAALFGFWRLIWKGLLAPDRRTNPERAYLSYALPYLFALVLWMLLVRTYEQVAD